MKSTNLVIFSLLAGLAIFGAASCESVDVYSEEFQEKAPLSDVGKSFQTTRSAEDVYKDTLAWIAENKAGGIHQANLSTEKNARITIDCTDTFVTDTSSGISKSDVTSEMTFAIDIEFKEGEIAFNSKDVVITPKVTCVYVKTLLGTRENKTKLHWGTMRHTEGFKGGSSPKKIREDGSSLYMSHVDAFLKGIEAISAH